MLLNAHTCLHTNSTWWLMITITMYNPWMKNSCTKKRCMKRRCFWGVSTEFEIRPANWLHSMHETAVPISWSPSTADEAWYWLKRVLHSGSLCITSYRPILREIWFVDCSCKSTVNFASKKMGLLFVCKFFVGKTLCYCMSVSQVVRPSWDNSAVAENVAVHHAVSISQKKSFFQCSLYCLM